VFALFFTSFIVAELVSHFRASNLGYNAAEETPSEWKEDIAHGGIKFQSGYWSLT
jgi:hypothetical protein